MKTFTFFWLEGKQEVLPGETADEALNKAGYGQGAIRALDFYCKGDNQQYEYLSGSWKIKEHLKMTIGELKEGQCFNFQHENMVRYVSEKGKTESYCPGVTQDTIGHDKQRGDEVYLNSAKVILIPNEACGVVRTPLSEDKQLADAIHDKTCRLNHTDYCRYHYTNWNDPGNTKKEYLMKAQVILKETDFNTAIKIINVYE